MPVIPYLPDNIEVPAATVTAIRQRRGGKLLKLDRMLLHSPPFATAWNSFLGVVRNELSLPAKIAELAICAVAILNKAWYELEQHAPEFIRAGGTTAQCDALRDIDTAAKNSQLFSREELATLQLTIEMTRTVTVPPATMDTIKSEFNNKQQLTELIGIIAVYNMVSRYLVALGIEAE